MRIYLYDLTDRNGTSCPNEEISRITNILGSRLVEAGVIEDPRLDNEIALYVKTEKSGICGESIWIREGQNLLCHSFNEGGGWQRLQC